MSKPENTLCPECGGRMVPRTARSDGRKFWGCRRFPDCKGTRDTDGRARHEKGAPFHEREHEDEEG